MSDKYQNKYRIPSARLKNWDYGWNAPYFVTICTQNRECFFGDITDGKMQLTEIGERAQKYWNEIPEHFPFVKLGVFAIMPNHLHGIIIIDKPVDGRDDYGRDDNGRDDGRDDYGRDDNGRDDGRDDNGRDDGRDDNGRDDNGRDAINRVSTTNGGITGNKNPMLNENLSRIIRWYKGRTSFECRKIHADFNWQTRFYDHIIKNDESFDNIHHYICNNPNNWADDKFFK